MKNFIASKINWSGIVIMLIGLQDFISSADFSAMTTKSWVTFSLGALIVIFRTWFTSTSIATKKS